MLIQKEIIINADIKDVWEIFYDLERWPEWSSYIIETKWITKGKWEKGCKFIQVVKGFGIIKKFQSKSIIKEVKPYNTVTWYGTRKWIMGTHTFKFQKIKNKTKVKNFEYFSGFAAPLLFPFFKNNFNLYFKQFLYGLKKESEKTNEN